MHLETQNKWKNKGPLNSDRKKKKRTPSLSVLTSPRVLVPLPDARCRDSLWVAAELPIPRTLQPVPTWAPPHLSSHCQATAPGKAGGSRVHGLSPASSQGCDAELAPPPLPSPRLLPVRARIPTPQARPESWQPAPSPEGELPAQNSPVLASTNPNWIPLPPTLDLVAS